MVDECEVSFQKLKTLLTTVPILTLPVEERVLSYMVMLLGLVLVVC